MFQRLKQNEKGLTLIELLVVIVILGIIAAIAIIAVGGIIDNSKKDAHIANAQQMASAAKLYVAAKDMNITTATDTATGTQKIKLSELIKENYMDKIKDPSNGDIEYDQEKSNVAITKQTDGSYTYVVTLMPKDGDTNYFVAEKGKTMPDANYLKRVNVQLP